MSGQLALAIASPAPSSAAARVYYEDEFATLHLGDCRDVLPMIERGSVSLVATDPPYGIDYLGRKSRRGAEHDHGKIAGDDGALDVMAIIGAAARTLSNNRHVYVFGFTAADATAVDCLAAPVDLTWDKIRPGMGDAEVMWSRSTEPILFATFEPSKANREHGYGALTARMRRGCVLRVPRLSSAANDDHPTGKPVALMRMLIESSSLVGDTVLDPFAGAGSTLVAAVLSGRQAIGIEMEEKYCERAARRLRAARTLRLAMETM